MNLWKAGLVVALGLLLAPRPSDACGGFFCDPPPPPDPDDPDLQLPIYQTGELVLFVGGEGVVEAHIQIQYAGEVDDFSWVVPVHVVPEIDFGSDEAFFALAGATSPVRQVEESRSECPTCNACPSRGWFRDPDVMFGGDDDADWGTDADSDMDSDTDSEEPGVQVIDSGIVGPFETVTLSSSSSAELIDWLTENAYDIPEVAYPIIDSYVAAGMYFVGLKLTKDAEAGDLRPIVLRMRGENLMPCVPLRLTAIAAAQEMPVAVWVLAESRAVPSNYHDVVLNDLLTHFSTSETYDSILSRAIDEVGGRGFVTEYAGSSEPVRSQLDTSRYDTALLATIEDPIAFVDEMVRQGFIQSRLVLELLRRFIPRPDSVPPDVDDTTFYACLDCDDGGCDDCYEKDIAGQPFDPVGFAEALQENIVRPLADLQEKFPTRPVLTSLRSVISPGEMTLDPDFAFRPDLPMVERTQTAERVRECQGSIDDADDYWSLHTPEGLQAGYVSFRPEDFDSLPAALRSYVRDGRENELVVDNFDSISSSAVDDIPTAISLRDDVFCECGRSDGLSQPGSGGLCTAAPYGTPGAAGIAFVCTVLVGILLARRRPS